MKNNKAISGIYDVLMFSIIIVMAVAFLQVYSLTHASTSVNNLKDQLSDDYAGSVLLTLTHVSEKDAGYETVQEGTIVEVSDKDLEYTVNESISARESLQKTDRTLERWVENATAWKEEASNRSASIIHDIDEIEATILYAHSALDESAWRMKSLSLKCAQMVEEAKKYEDLIGGMGITETDPCAYLDERNGQISAMAENISKDLDGITQKLEATKNAVSAADLEAQENTDEAIALLTQARCALREVNVKIDNFASYLQLGVKEDATLVDLLPTKADLENMPAAEMLGESLYVEDRLAQSDYWRSGAAIAARLALKGQSGNESQQNGTQTTLNGTNNTKSRIAQATLLTLIRLDYREKAKAAVTGILEKALTEQGYKYCFKAQTCCSPMNKIFIGECDNIPPDTGQANRNIRTIDGDKGDMTLHIWRR